MGTKPVLSENVQMYLVQILRLKGEQPLPLSELAEALDVSPISVNQMCRKLQEAGWVDYVPYKGVSLTAAGERLAARILRRHRMWEVFLVEHLRMGVEEAHDAACLLEHNTPDEVIERLAAFLEHPRVNPQGEPIPAATGKLPTMPTLRLSEIEVGQKAHLLNCAADAASSAFLARQGLRPGASIHVLAVSPQSLLIEVNGQRVALAHSLAATVQIQLEELPSA